MGRPERSAPFEPPSHLPGDGIDLPGLQRFAAAHRRKDAGKSLRQAGLSGAGRTYHDYVVGAGCHDLHAPLRAFLPYDLGKVDCGLLLRGAARLGTSADLQRIRASRRAQYLHRFGEGVGAVDRKAVDFSGFGG